MQNLNQIILCQTKIPAPLPTPHNINWLLCKYVCIILEQNIFERFIDN